MRRNALTHGFCGWQALRNHLLQMLQSLGYGERIHLLGSAFTGFQRPLQIVPGDFDGQRIGDDLAFPILVLHPGGTGERDLHRPPIDQKLDIHRIRVPGGDSYNQGLINAVHFLLGPAVNGVKVLIHTKTIADRMGGEQSRCVRLNYDGRPWAKSGD